MLHYCCFSSIAHIKQVIAKDKVCSTKRTGLLLSRHAQQEVLPFADNKAADRNAFARVY